MTSGDDSGDLGGTSKPAKARFFPDVVAALEATAVAQRRAALVVVGHATDPDDALELLDMLGLLDPARLRREMTTEASSGDSTAPGEARGHLVDAAAAAVLGMPEHTLRRFDDARIIAPARIDSHGARWWNPHDLRRQLAAYLEGQDVDQP